MEREGEVGRGKGRGRRGDVEKMRGLVIGGMVIGLLLGCNNGAIEDLEKRNTFFESVSKIGQGFQEVFGIFGNTIGDALGFNAVKSDDNRSKVKEHFEKIRDGLTQTKDKLKNELSSQISQAKNADGSAVKVVDGAIKEASDIFEKLIGALTKLAGSVGDTKIAEGAISTSAKAAEAATKDSVDAFIEGVRAIINNAKESKVKIEEGKAGDKPVTGGNNTAGAVLVGVALAAAPNANSGPLLAAEVAQADPWAMIDKIKEAKTSSGGNTGATNDVGTLVTKVSNGPSNNGASTNADLAAAVALKAMTKNGKFTNADNEEGAVKAAAGAVNKVLGVLDEIIRRTVSKELYKVGKAVNGMQYSENTAEKSEATAK